MEEDAEGSCDACSKDNANSAEATVIPSSAESTLSTAAVPSVSATVAEPSITPAAGETSIETAASCHPPAVKESQIVTRPEHHVKDGSEKPQVEESQAEINTEDTINAETSIEIEHMKSVEESTSKVTDVNASIVDTKLDQEVHRTQSDVKQMDTELTADCEKAGDKNSDKSDTENPSDEQVEKKEDKTEQEPVIEKIPTRPTDDVKMQNEKDTVESVKIGEDMSNHNSISDITSKVETVMECTDTQNGSDKSSSSLPEEVVHVATASDIQLTSTVSTMASVKSSVTSQSFTSTTATKTTVMTMTVAATTSSLTMLESCPKPVMSSTISIVSPAPSFTPQISVAPVVSTDAQHPLVAAGPSVSIATGGSLLNHNVLQRGFHQPAVSSASVSPAVVQSVSHQLAEQNNPCTAVAVNTSRMSSVHVDTVIASSALVSVAPGTSQPVSPVLAESRERKHMPPVSSPVPQISTPQVVKVLTHNAQTSEKDATKDLKKESTPVTATRPSVVKVAPESEERGQGMQTQTLEPSHTESAAEKAKSGGGATKGISILKPLYDKEAFFDDELDVSQPGKTEPVIEEIAESEAANADPISAIKQLQKKPQSTVAQLLQDAEKRQSAASVQQPVQSTSTVNQAVVTTSSTLQTVQSPSLNPTSTISVTTTTHSLSAPLVSTVPIVRAPVTLLNAMSKLQPPVLSSTTLGIELPNVVRASIAVAVRNAAPSVSSQLRHTVQNLLAKPVVTPDQQKVVPTTVQQSSSQVKVPVTSCASSSAAAPVNSTPEQLAQSIIKVAQEREKAAEKAKTAKKPHVTNTVTSFATPGNTAHLSNFVQKSLSTPVKVNAVSHHHPIMAPGFHLNLTESVQKVMKPIPSSDTTPPPSPKTSKTQASTSQGVISPAKQLHVKVPYSTVTSRGASPVRLPETLVELTSVLDSKTITTTSNKPMQQLNHALSPVTVLNRQKTPSPQPAISALNISSANTYHRAVSPGMSSNMNMIHTSPQRISPSLSRTPSPRANPQLSPSRSSNYHISPPRSAPSPHGEHRKTPSPASSVAQKNTPPLLMRASPSKVSPNVVQLASNPVSGDSLVPTTTVITLRQTGVTGLVGEHSYSAKPVLANHPTNAATSTVILEGSNTAEVLQPKHLEPVHKPRVLDLSSAVEVKKPEFGSKIHNVNASLVARAMAAQAKKDVPPTTSAVVPAESLVKVTASASVSKPLQPITRQVTIKAQPEPMLETPKVTPPSELPIEISHVKSDQNLEEGSSPVHIIHPVSKTYSKATAKAPVTRNCVDRESTPTENTLLQEESASTIKAEAVKTRASSKRKMSDSVIIDESDGPSKPAKVLRSSTELPKEEEVAQTKAPGRIGRRASRESTESRASSADSKMDKDIKLNLPSTRSRRKSLSECSDTSSIADEQSGTRTRRGGLRAPSDRSESPAPRSSARLSTRSSARRRQTEDSASPTKQPPTPSPTPPPPAVAADANPPPAAEKVPTRQNRSKRKQPSDEVGDVPEKKSKDDVEDESGKGKTDVALKAKRSCSPVKNEDDKSKTGKIVQKSKVQLKKKDDHQSQGMFSITSMCIKFNIVICMNTHTSFMESKIYFYYCFCI